MKNFRLHLTLIIIVFSIFISFIVAFFDQVKLKNRLIEDYASRLSATEDSIIESLHTIDKAYLFFDADIAQKMKKNSDELLSLYEKNPNFDEWDFHALKTYYGMDIYIINEKNVITYSSFPDDIGLDFQSCCKKLSEILDTRRNAGVFADDGMDIQQSDGGIKKFSYAPTPDKKYIIELGVELSDGEIFKHFNFLDLANGLEKKYSFINNINIYSRGGHQFIASGNEKEGDIKRESEKWPHFRKALESGKPTEVKGKWENLDATYRYIPYIATEKRGVSTDRVVEIVYNDFPLRLALLDNKKQFVLQLLVIFLGAILLSLFIARWIGRPMFLAFHDSLTGLKNRAAFEDLVSQQLQKKNVNTALMMIDLDNFKLVNDRLGHTEGDRILKITAETIASFLSKNDHAVRIGGDEFGVIFANIKVEDISMIASGMLSLMEQRFHDLPENIDVSMSIGIAFADEKDNVDTLYAKADSALYQSKNNGKNQYHIYRELLKT
ncbi:GGDEF domain-containing protein [Lederbergia wuyishanensis]|uniref:Diguanylate cyclase (GGDEF)-like protein n=1 Tax=Lederbergia wuyishanensis TaxID=1347903 RepID=A0ABU0D9S2_9BACI|nr:GGDEF domain-containing protein [Lederbergia wuyishanensis]MCJ8008416.1 GGDEF domain-containing protein [Lederbergia wuyishanensis]MDQ0345158.1 diguanylate cyclase (GGDEF)-like protein [Lederbergia wuyishanensis]